MILVYFLMGYSINPLQILNILNYLHNSEGVKKNRICLYVSFKVYV